MTLLPARLRSLNLAKNDGKPSRKGRKELPGGVCVFFVGCEQFFQNAGPKGT